MAKLSDCIFLMTHGAGAGVSSEFIQYISYNLKAKGVKVALFEFPYMITSQLEKKRRPPDRMPKLIESFNQEIDRLIENLEPEHRLFIGGKSMGGRVASLAAVERLANAGYSKANDESKQRSIAGIICMGFPFHPPKKLDKYRGDHLVSIDVPTLILQGDRDTFGTQQEVEAFPLSNKVTVQFIKDGDHSFKPRVKSGLTQTDNYITSCEHIIKFMLANK